MQLINIIIKWYKDRRSSTGHAYENLVLSGVNALQSFDLYSHVGTAGKIAEHTHSAELFFAHAFTRFASSHGNAFLLLDESIRKQVSNLALYRAFFQTFFFKFSRFYTCIWALRATDQKHLESLEMWCWRRMEKISWSDHVRN